MAGCMRWSFSLAALLLLPKCVLCLAPYFALGAGAGAIGSELCGAGGDTNDILGFVATNAPLYLVSSLTAAGVFMAFRRVRSRERLPTEQTVH
jgi:hypothetical protein